MRAIDVWVILCYVGVFYALIEYCIIIYLTKVDKTKNKTKLLTNNHVEEIIEDEVALPKREQSASSQIILANNLEKISRIILTLYNIVFSVCYFVVCTLCN